MYNKIEDNFINKVDYSKKQEYNQELISQYNRIVSIWEIPKNILNLWIDGIANSDNFVSKHYKNRNKNIVSNTNLSDIDEQQSVAKRFNDKLIDWSYDSASRTDHEKRVKSKILDKIRSWKINTEQWVDEISHQTKIYQEKYEKFENIIKDFDVKDTIANKIVEIVIWDYISYMLNKWDRKHVYKVYNTNLYDDVMSGIDFIIEKKKYDNDPNPYYIGLDLTSSKDKSDSRTIPVDFFVNKWIKLNSISRKILYIGNFDIVYKYLNEYMRYMYENETTNLSKHDMANISKEVKDLLGIDGHMLDIKDDLLQLIS